MDRKKVLVACSLGIVMVISVCIYTQASCDNSLNNIARSYEQCKKTLQQDVTTQLLPLIGRRDALKKKLDELTSLLNNYDKKKEELTKSIQNLEKQATEKGCVNCPIEHTQNNNSGNNNTGTGNNNSSTCGKDKDKVPLCMSRDICQKCSSLVHQPTGKSLCEVCGCNCK